MYDSTVSNFFVNAVVSTTNFADCVYSWPFNSTGMTILNESTSIIEYSFDGLLVAGDLNSAYFIGVSFDQRQECKIYFRLASAGSSAKVRFECWG